MLSASFVGLRATQAEAGVALGPPRSSVAGLECAVATVGSEGEAFEQVGSGPVAARPRILRQLVLIQVRLRGPVTRRVEGLRRVRDRERILITVM